jgi:hypothetical protein
MCCYIAGAAVSAVTAWFLKRKFPGQKKYGQASLVVMGSFVIAAALWQMDGVAGQQQAIAKNEPGKGSQEREYLVDAEGILEGYPLEVQIEERKLTEAQCEEYFERAKQELDVLILGENPSLDEVSQSLQLPDTLQDGAVEAEYQFSDYEVFQPDGTLKAEPGSPVIVKQNCPARREIAYIHFLCVQYRGTGRQRKHLQTISDRRWKRRTKRKGADI